MATDTSFANMLNEYAPEKMIYNEIVKRDYILSKAKKDDKWKGGSLPVPFLNQKGSTVQFGSLAASNDISEYKYLRGTMSPKEIWGSLIFNARDIRRNGKVSEQSFINVLDDQMPDFLQTFKERTSFALLNNGGFYAKATVDGTANGEITVDRPELLHLGQKVVVDDDNSGTATGYITEIDINTGLIVVQDARSGGADVDLSGYTVAQNAKVYEVGATTASNLPQSVVDALLSNANGGGATLYGLNKDATNPSLQAINVSGASMTSSNVLDEIFEAFIRVKKKGRGNPTEVWMDYDNWGACLKRLNTLKSPYNIVPNSQKASEYGWDEIEIGGPKGKLKFVAINEMRNDVMPIIDWNSIKVYSVGGPQKQRDPETGNPFFTVRNTTGYQYIVDHLYELEQCVKPQGCGIIHSVPSNLL